MAKYKIEEEKIYGQTVSYFVKVKNFWWPFWRYTKRKDGSIVNFKTKKGAQAFINLHSVKDEK